MKTQIRPDQPIKPGDIVAYRARFLRSIGTYTGEICFATGQVQSLEPLTAHVVLAAVNWDKANIPQRVNVANLVRVNSPEFSYE